MKYIITIAIIYTNYISISQNRNIIGIAMNESYGMFLSKILFIDSNDRIICRATTDFDGVFKISNLPDSAVVKYIVSDSECTVPDTIRKFDLYLDTLKLIFVVKEVECATKSYNNCPNYNEFCEVYRAADLLTNPYDRIEGDVINDSNQKIWIKIRKPTYSQNGCCINKWYCKTHNVDY